ncbi:MAG: PilZ domain-containing protein [Desulfocapsaceae bacterium]|nr:PilZ domain-containing protein [Desulfocapsaceae bacterium]
MTTEQTDPNKRKYVRYDIELGSFAVFRRDMSVLPGLIVDISKGGLAFFYHEDEDWPQDNSELFYLFGDKYNVENVSLITTYDAEVTDMNHPVLQILAAQKSGPIKIRRRGVQFGPLSKEQEKDIEALIDEYYASRK